MDFWKALISNYVLMSALSGWFFAQVIKVIIGLFDKKHKNPFSLMFSTGGMPSSHTSTVTALCISTFISEGVSSPLFVITLAFAAIVMVDASGVRYQTGKQSVIIKRITAKIFSEDADEINAGLKELVGHTHMQVIMGALLGAVLAIALKFIMGVDMVI
jgi:acid phosphatase family membrane protein YuiD